MSNRVPQIVLLYWVIKIASTTLGETGADLFSMTLGLGYAATIAIFMAILVAALGLKLALGRYEPASYWLAFTATAIVGTAMSDFMDRTLGLGYAGGALVLTLSLMAVLKLWHSVEHSVSVEHITTLKSELFYWAAFLVANTLGTAAGDYLADDLGLGFLTSAGLVSALLLATAALHFTHKVHGTVLFWIAFVLTRPFGATSGDLLTKGTDEGGLGLGTVATSGLFLLLLLAALSVELRGHRQTVRAEP